MKESKDLRLEEEARENANPQEEATTTEEGMKDQTEAVEEKEVNEPDSEEKNEEGEEDENEEKENSSTRKILIFSIVGVVAAALIITLCIVFVSSTRKDKQEEIANQQTNIKEETEEQTTTIEEVAEVEAESTPEPTAEPTPEPTEEPKQAASLEEYIAQLDPNEICVVVWNENTNRQEKFTEDQKCIVKDGDIVVVPVAERPIMSVYYDSISQEYNEKGYFVVNVENPKWIAISITYQIGEDEYDNICLPAKKE